MFRKVRLKNNIPVLLYRMDSVRSVCTGIWVTVGSRHERSEANGISHFIEHMFFKGTETRSAEEIAKEIDSLGGEVNAVTSTEYTMYYVRVMDEYHKKALTLLTDIFMNSILPEDEMEKEKRVIIEEIKMVEDNPSEYIHDIFSRTLWGDEGLGQPVLGRKETVSRFTRDDLLRHIRNFYTSSNIIVSCTGNFDEDDVVSFLDETIGNIRRQDAQPPLLDHTFSSTINVVHRDLSESHICIGLKALPYGSEERYAMHLLNTILGTGYSSRLFQEIREKRGLAYSIYSYQLAFHDTGVWVIYAGTDRRHVSDVVNITVDEVMSLPETITEDELKRAKTQVKGNLLLALESTTNKMTSIAKQEIYYGRYISPEEVSVRIDSITLDQIRDLSRRLINNSGFAMTVYGPVKEKDLKGKCRLLP